MIQSMLYDRVLVLEVKNQNEALVKREGSPIFLRSSDEELFDDVRRAEVVAIGPDVLETKVNSNVCWRKQTTGRPVTYKGLTYIMLREDELEGVLI